ncbi:MAG: hypothetical protein WCN88_04865 [Candidatus Falkowbacteria bacterium]
MEQKTIDINFNQRGNNEVAPTDIKTGTNQDFINQKFLETYQIKQHWKVVPTYYPKNFYEQTVYFDDGINRRIYTFINGVWRYVTMT